MVNLQEEKILKTLSRLVDDALRSPHFCKILIENCSGVYANRFFAVYSGEDFLSKYWLLRRKALIFDVPEKPIEITGPDAERFLENFDTEGSGIKEGRGFYAHQRVAFLWMEFFLSSDEKYWYVQADGPFETWLLANCVVTT